MLEKHLKFGFEVVRSVALKGIANLTRNLPSGRQQFEDDSASGKSAV